MSHSAGTNHLLVGETRCNSTVRDNPIPTRIGSYMGFSISKRVALVGCGVLTLAAAACGDSNDSGTNPGGPRGDFAVQTATTGVEFDNSGYEVRVNGVFASLMGPNDSVEFVDRAVDTYSVELAEVAANCAVAGDNPRPVLVIADSKTATTFEVACLATAGVLQVVTATSGVNRDDGYTLAVDGLDAGSIGANDTTRTADLATGEHTVRLGEIALNCRLVGDPEREVLVPREDTIETTYEVVCTDQVGSLRIITSTAGNVPDPDGYEVDIEFADPIPVEAVDTVTVRSVAGGVTSVGLRESSVADNCSVEGENPRSVTVQVGGLVSTEFQVACVSKP